MQNLIHKVTSTLSGIALFTIGCVFAVLGFSVLGFLVLFALAATGLALLAAPLVAMKEADESQSG